MHGRLIQRIPLGAFTRKTAKQIETSASLADVWHLNAFVYVLEDHGVRVGAETRAAWA